MKLWLSSIILMLITCTINLSATKIENDGITIDHKAQHSLIHTLDDYTLSHALSYITRRDIFNVMQVDKRFYKLVDQPQCWIEFYKRARYLENNTHLKNGTDYKENFRYYSTPAFMTNINDNFVQPTQCDQNVQLLINRFNSKINAYLDSSNTTRYQVNEISSNKCCYIGTSIHYLQYTANTYSTATLWRKKPQIQNSSSIDLAEDPYNFERVHLYVLDGFTSTIPRAINQDGRIVAGYCFKSHSNLRKAFVWYREKINCLKTLLRQHGVTIDKDLDLITVDWISPNGCVFEGEASNYDKEINQRFRAVLSLDNDF